MRWNPKVKPVKEGSKVRLVQQLLFGQSTQPSCSTKGVFLATQMRDTEYTDVHPAEGPPKRKRVVFPKYCVYSLLGRHCQAGTAHCLPLSGGCPPNDHSPDHGILHQILGCGHSSEMSTFTVPLSVVGFFVGAPQLHCATSWSFTASCLSSSFISVSL